MENNKTSQRRLNRMTTLEFMYQWEFNKPENLKDSVRDFIKEKEFERDYYEFAESLIFGIVQEIKAIDSHIIKVAKNWDFNRIAKVDLTILRLSVYELFYRNDIPPIVTINEAIELGKLYSNIESKRFINGILDKVLESIKRPHRNAKL